jgi:adenylate cyclase
MNDLAEGPLGTEEADEPYQGEQLLPQNLPPSQLQQCPDVTSITDWIIQQGLLRASLESLLEGFCDRLIAIGVPIWRGYISARTLHPRIAGLGCSWRPDEGIRSDVFVHSLTPSKAYLQSPFKRILEQGGEELRIRFQPDVPSEFPVCEGLRQEGATDYLAHLIAFGEQGIADGKTGVMASWSTTEQDGFSERDLAILRHMTPRLGLAMQARLSRDIAVNLLDTYVGPEAGRRILDGEIRRGALEVISAVIFYADLRGFTAMSDRLPHDEMVDMLNAYFDCLVPGIVAHEGNVLSFLGDGLLATFPLEGEDAAVRCAQALEAATEVLAAVEQLSAERIAAGQPTMNLDIVLHLGDVYWGNVGSADRLDFTVIGPAVNEAARIEALCGQQERCLLISETFAAAATQSANRLVSIGRYALRGVSSAQSIYTLEAL